MLGWSRWQHLDNPRCARRLLARGLAPAVRAGLIVEQPAEPLTCGGAPRIKESGRLG
ncbi:hypothetical protein [Microtetraspora fusca]|uniref:hypothetical protein n=1 Tax=Microtetraspora fusca TaxID=1997 RepID=UPI0012FA5491|nr:hypothetical protein [Microtetraspora fusca]